MHRTPFARAALLLLAACAPVPSPPPMPPPAPPSAGGGAGASAAAGERTVHQRINEARLRGGCPALQWSDAAARVARAHSADMARRGYFSHTSPEGSQPGSRLAAAGVGWSRVAENIAFNGGSAEQAVQQWLGSSGHRANILNCAYTHAGVGEAAGRWTQLFFTPRGA